MTDELIATASRLAVASGKTPRQADLKRAVSTAYYALFHAIARECADLIAGAGRNRADAAWARVYRGVEHGFAKRACGQVRGLGFPPTICACADAFVVLQEARHSADYDPNHRVSRTDALAAITTADQAIRDLRATPRKTRRAFAIQLLVRSRT